MLKLIKKALANEALQFLIILGLAGAFGGCLDSTLKNDFDPEAGIGIAVPIILGIQANADTTCYYDKISSIYDVCTFGP